MWSRKQAHHFKRRLSLMRNEFIRGEGGKVALLYERKPRAAPGGPGGEPSTASLGPQSGAFHLPPRLGLRLLSWVAEVGLAHGSWQAPWVPPWPGPLGPCPWPFEVSGHCLGPASVPSAAASCLGAQWAASSWLPLETCLQGDTVSGPPGVRIDRPVVPRCPEPCLPHTFIRFLAHSLAEILSLILFFLLLAGPLCLWRGPGVLCIAIPIGLRPRPLHARQALLPGGGTLVNVAVCTWDPASTAW